MMLRWGAALAALLSVSPAVAQEDSPKWSVKLGVTRLTLADEIDLSVAGTPVPGTALDTKSHYTPTIQVSRQVSSDFAVSLIVGVPPHIDIGGGGTLKPFGKLAETTYGPACLSLQFKPLKGTFQPYVGAGAAYMHVFSAKDGAFQDVEIDDDLAPVVEAGADIMITPRYGIYFEAKKAYLRTQTRGTFGGAPVVGNVRLDPWALSAGAVIRF